MSLIEQLGGYERASWFLDFYEHSIGFNYCLDSSGTFDTWKYLYVVIPNLKEELLKHNIKD